MLQWWKKKFRREKRHFRERDILRQLTPYFPNSAHAINYPALTYSCANNLPVLLERLIQQSPLAPKLPNVRPVDQIGSSDQRLGDLLDRYGSDKNQLHNYTPLYASILQPLRDRPDVALLEVGLGTNNPSLVSSMGTEGKPGASLRAFAEYLPGARIFGADIDKAILFSTDQIRTAAVDQLTPATFSEMATTLGCDRFDVIIDDGLHSPEANLNTLIYGLSALKPRGWIIIEDIPARSLMVWSTVGAVLASRDLRCEIVRANNESHLFVVERLG